MKMFASFFLAGILATAFGQGLINRRAPSFSLPDSAFTQYDILDYRGKWLLLEFLSTSGQTCPSCKENTKKLDALMAKNSSRLAVLAIANTPPETQDTVKAFVNETKVKIPILFDASMVALAYFKATPSNNSIPTGYVFAINPQGTIVQAWTSELAAKPGFAADVETLIGGGASKSAPASAKGAKAKK